MTRTLGKNLKVGDTIEVWWSSCDGQKGHFDVIKALKSYGGPLAYLWKQGAQLADFQFNRVGMTIDNGAYYNVV